MAESMPCDLNRLSVRGDLHFYHLHRHADSLETPLLPNSVSAFHAKRTPGRQLPNPYHPRGCSSFYGHSSFLNLQKVQHSTQGPPDLWEIVLFGPQYKLYSLTFCLFLLHIHWGSHSFPRSHCRLLILQCHLTSCS